MEGLRLLRSGVDLRRSPPLRDVWSPCSRRQSFRWCWSSVVRHLFCSDVEQSTSSVDGWAPFDDHVDRQSCPTSFFRQHALTRLRIDLTTPPGMMWGGGTNSSANTLSVLPFVVSLVTKSARYPGGQCWREAGVASSSAKSKLPGTLMMSTASTSTTSSMGLWNDHGGVRLLQRMLFHHLRLFLSSPALLSYSTNHDAEVCSRQSLTYWHPRPAACSIGTSEWWRW